MIRFFVYLLESGLCLTLLYLGYLLFLRKETYFGFIRIFLVGSMAISLLMPMIHLNLIIPRGSTWEEPASGIVQVRNYYQDWIRMIDADFGLEPGQQHMAGRLPGEAEGLDGAERVSPITIRDEQLSMQSAARTLKIRGVVIAFTGILFFIYIAGVIYFLARFAYLVIRLYLLASRNGTTRQHGFRMVEIRDEISPFSFFRFLFINQQSFNQQEFQQVLEHEKAHIRQWHSLDHLFAHAVAVFQWFNPVAWSLRKALKTTHEYIADQEVLVQGVEKFDYQALLLRQVIGYHSVELVNNFNLKPIKKRIAMMNKIRSGIPARIKAIAVIPITLVLFFLFADFTLQGTDVGIAQPIGELEGLWVKESKDDFSKVVSIEDQTFSFAKGMEISQYFLSIKEPYLELSHREGGAGIQLRYKVKDNELLIWWNDQQSSRYIRSRAENTLDHFLTTQELSLDLPTIYQYRLLENESMRYTICYGKDPSGGTLMTFNGKAFNLKDLDDLVETEKNRVSKLDQRSLTALFLIDKSIPMAQVNGVREELRKIGALHFAEGGYPHGEMELSPLLYQAVGLPRVLPPLQAKKLDKEVFIKQGGELHTIDLSLRNTTPRDVDEGIRNFIENSEKGKYLISLEYDGKTTYGEYVETVDMIWRTVYSFREALSQERYSIPYSALGADLQREIRKIYPMPVSEEMR